MKNSLSVVIITFNEESNIKRCLDSVRNLSDDIVIIDSFSTDNTKKICTQYSNVTFLENKFGGYGAQKQLAVSQAKHDWIFSIDADECISTDLQNEILETISKPENEKFSFSINRRMIFLGKEMRFSGLGTEYCLRLFNRKQANFNNNLVHETVISAVSTKKLRNNFYHYSYKDLKSLEDKQNSYTSLWATEQFKNGKKCNFAKVFLKTSVAFTRCYFFKLGFLDGFQGFLWAKYHARYILSKYAKLLELSTLNK